MEEMTWILAYLSCVTLGPSKSPFFSFWNGYNNPFIYPSKLFINSSIVKLSALYLNLRVLKCEWWGKHFLFHVYQPFDRFKYNKMEWMASLFALTPAYVWKHYCCGNWFYNTPKYPRLSKKKILLTWKKKVNYFLLSY